VQVVGIEDIGISKINQIDRIEMGERGEFMKGKEVIRLVPEEEGDEGGEGGPVAGRPKVVVAGTGPHKLLMEDAGGRGVYGIELQSVQGIQVDMPMGAKMVLKNVTVARGILLLTPANTLVLGGKVEALNQQYLANRKQVLNAALEKLRSQS
jgi:RecQ-mediated genome instability protein 1